MKITIKQLKKLIREAFDVESSGTISTTDVKQFITRVFNERSYPSDIRKFFISYGLDEDTAYYFATDLLSFKVIMENSKNPREVKEDDKEQWEFYMARALPVFHQLGLKPEDFGIIFPDKEWSTNLEKSKDFIGDFRTYEDDDDYEYYRGRR